MLAELEASRPKWKDAKEAATLLVATDGSDGALHAAELAVRPAGLLGAKLHILYVLDEDRAFRTGIHEGQRRSGEDPDLREIEEKLRLLLRFYSAPVRVSIVSADNENLTQRCGADSPSLFLVRPDGHVAYRGPAEDLDRFGSYLDGLFAGRVDQGVGLERSVGA